MVRPRGTEGGSEKDVGHALRLTHLVGREASSEREGRRELGAGTGLSLSRAGYALAPYSGRMGLVPSSCGSLVHLPQPANCQPW